MRVGSDIRIAELEAALARRDQLIAERDHLIAERDQLIAALGAVVHQQHETIAALQATVVEQQRAITKLEEEVGKNSRNSGKPPSSDPPGTRSATRVLKQGEPKRKPGGQKGHKGRSRVLVDPSKVARREVRAASACSGRGGTNLKPRPDLEPTRTQLVELPPEFSDVTEFVGVASECGDCEAITYGTPPKEALASPFGPRLTALVALLRADYRQSVRKLQQLLEIC